MVDGRGSQALYRVNISTGAAPQVGVHGIGDMFGLAFHPPSNTLFGVANGSLFRIDTATGAATFIGNTGLSLVDGLTYDSKRDVMYALTAGSSTLFTIDLATATVTGLVFNGFINDLGMTYDPVTDRLLVADFNGRFLDFDPNAGFRLSTRGTLPDAFTCLASVPLP